MSDTGAHEAYQAQINLLRLGFKKSDLEDICMIPDCYCDGDPHP